jgi:hypothetical protein
MNPMYAAYIQAQKLPTELRRQAILLTTCLLPIENVRVSSLAGD